MENCKDLFICEAKDADYEAILAVNDTDLRQTSSMDVTRLPELIMFSARNSQFFYIDIGTVLYKGLFDGVYSKDLAIIL